MTNPFITVVSGLPRSGTSLLMQMLASGGLPILSDGRRTPDQHNPRGYFELESVKHTRTDPSWLKEAQGKAVKVVHLLLPSLPPQFQYRVILMERNLTEVIASQRAMLTQQGRPVAALSDAKMIEVFQKQLAEVRQWLSQQTHFQLLEMPHRDVIERPADAASKIAAFLGGHLDSQRMAAAVDSRLYRQRQNPPA